MELNVLILKDYFIFHQLQLEEALLRTNNENWLILNYGSPPAIVMGISGVFDELIYREKAKHLSLPVIKRFSGGGTVVVDKDTLFFTLIMNKHEVSCTAYPKPIMQWIENQIKPAFPSGFSLTENDFTIGSKKCGGNAQYIQKDKWLHHTTFLWDYCSEKMNALLMPKKRPDYRKDRHHTDFLCYLKEYFSDMNELGLKILQTFDTYHVKIRSLEDALKHLPSEHRKSTTLIEY